MLELKTALVDEGEMLEDLDRCLRRAGEHSVRFHFDNPRAKPGDCKSVVKLEIEILPNEDYDSNFNVNYRIKNVYPQPLKRCTLVRQEGTRLFMDPVGSDNRDANQVKINYSEENKDE